MSVTQTSQQQQQQQRPSRWEVARQLARVGRLARKEMAEIFSDRRTIFTLVLMPMLLYPVLSFAFKQFMLSVMGPGIGDRPYLIGVETEVDQRIVEKYLAYGNEVDALAALVGLAAPSTAGGNWGAGSLLLDGRLGRNLGVNPPPYDPARFGVAWFPRVQVVVVRKPIAKPLLSGEIDVALFVREPSGKRLAVAGNGAVDVKHPLVLDWEIQYYRHLARSREVVAYLDQQIELANARQVQGVLTRHGEGLRPVPVRLLRANTEVTEGTPALSMATLVPLILILMTITGAVYPAIDLTAGERERGTLEILVAAPVPRLALLFAKYLAVLAVAMLTAVINLAMMLLTLQLNGLTSQVFKDTGITVELVLQLLALLVLFATFFSAVLLALTSFARSFKEAQAYLIPLMLVSLAPGVIAMMPGLRLQGVLAVTPLMNIVLLARDLADGKAAVGPSAVVIVSTLVYALAAITIAVRIFGAEAVLYSEQKGWSDLLRRPAQARPNATVAGALLCLAMLLPIYFVIVSMVPAGPQARLIYVGVGTLLMFAGMPLAACLMGRITVVSSLQLERPRWHAWLAALLLAVAAVPAVFYVMLGLRDGGLFFLDEQKLSQLNVQGLPFQRMPGLAIGMLALAGLAEELFFRGFLFSALRGHTGKRLTIVGSAVLFGLFHFVTVFDRLIPSTLMGLLLGYVCWQTRSVWPGMLLHALYNASWGWLTYDALISDRSGLDPRIPLWWRIAAVPAALAGAGLLHSLGRGRSVRAERH